MRIGVFCGSGFGEKPSYRKAAEELGKWIGESGHELVYGGSDCGLMGVLADAALAAGAKVTGVEPEFFLEQGLEHKGITETISCHTMSERKSIMSQRSDAYIALPGGIGTLDEFSEVAVLSGLGREDKPCILYNVDGYYDLLLEFFGQMVRDGFLSDENLAKILSVRSIPELEEVLDAADIPEDR